MEKSDNIQDMWLFIRKWWVLRRLRKEIAQHTQEMKLDDVKKGHYVTLTRKFFISGSPQSPKYPGIAQRSVRRFSWILWWRKKDNSKKLKKRIREYNDIYRSLIVEEYIVLERTLKGQELPSVGNPKADKIHGWFGLLEAILSRYPKAWVFAIMPLFAGAIGSGLVKKVADYITEFFINL